MFLRIYSRNPTSSSYIYSRDFQVVHFLVLYHKPHVGTGISEILITRGLSPPARYGLPTPIRIAWQYVLALLTRHAIIAVLRFPTK